MRSIEIECITAIFCLKASILTPFTWTFWYSFSKVYNVHSERIDSKIALLYQTRCASGDFSRTTFNVILERFSKRVIMLAHRGYFKQTDGTPWRSSVGPQLANILVSNYNSELEARNKFFFDNFFSIQSDIMDLRHQSSAMCIIMLGGEDTHPWSATNIGNLIIATIPVDM